MKSIILFILCVVTACSSPTSAPPTYTFQASASPIEGGIITPADGSFQEGRQISVLATPTAGWRFVRWEGDIVSTQNPSSYIVAKNTRVTGIFERREYPLNITIVGSGSVLEEVVTARNYPFQTRVKLTAVPTNGWEFSAWGGDASGGQNPIEITITTETAIIATFRGVAPTVVTESARNITASGATVPGAVTSQGSSEVTVRGVCYATTQNPTTANTCVASGTGMGSFTVTLTGLNSEVTYYVRAYATNLIGTSYGSQIEFTTSAPAPSLHGRDSTTAIVEVRNPTTGKVWMDRNLGASRAATSITDINALGDLYQWGRSADGHQSRNSLNTTTLSSSDSPGNANFITSITEPYDWRSPANINLWQGVNGLNNPCPVGFRVPTYTEWHTERQSWSSNNSAGAFASPLKLPLAGVRRSDGTTHHVGTHGFYWTSTVVINYSWSQNFDSRSTYNSQSGRANGLPVRCIKD
jgi:hypothetical protein